MLESEEILKSLLDVRKTNQLYMVYQPILDLHSNCISGFEALMRWNSPEWGVIPPDVFIRLLEESGSIFPVEDMVALTPWETAALWEDGLSLSINFSALELCNPDLSERVMENLVKFHLPPYRCEIEITETLPISDNEVVMKNITKIKEKGIKLTLDDFGTGHANLDCLLKYPFDTIKIDKIFMTEIIQGSKSGKIFESIITLAHSLGISVIAEGIENKSQIDALRNIGCDKAQGFYISPPILPEEIPRLLKRYV